MPHDLCNDNKVHKNFKWKICFDLSLILKFVKNDYSVQTMSDEK